MAIKKTRTTEPTERRVRVSTVDPNETKEQKFIRLATRRVLKVQKALDQIGLLGGSAYTSTEVQRNKISEALTDSLTFNLNRLNKTKTSKSDFRL